MLRKIQHFQYQESVNIDIILSQINHISDNIIRSCFFTGKSEKRVILGAFAFQNAIL